MLEKIGTKIGAKSTNWAESEIHMPLNRQNTLKDTEKYLLLYTSC